MLIADMTTDRAGQQGTFRTKKQQQRESKNSSPHSIILTRFDWNQITSQFQPANKLIRLFFDINFLIFSE